MGKYVLAVYHPHMGGHVFICGGPFPPTFDVDVNRASRFDRIEDAVIVRRNMPHQLGGNDQYHVHEVMPDGRLVDLEA